jgi:hypothetical protein
LSAKSHRSALEGRKISRRVDSEKTGGKNPFLAQGFNVRPWKAGIGDVRRCCKFVTKVADECLGGAKDFSKEHFQKSVAEESGRLQDLNIGIRGT